MTLAGDLCTAALTRIVERFALREVTTDGGPFLPLPPQAPGGEPGICRVFQGGPVSRAVYVALAFPPAGLDSHMLFAFADNTSAVPHFTIDSVQAGGHYAFHLDLLPRVDPGAHLAYIDHVYAPLTDHVTSAQSNDGFSLAHLSPRQVGLMSPWMLAYRATEDAFAGIRGPLDAYLDQWTKLAENGIPPELLDGVTGEAIAERDRRNRASLFDPDVDPVWDQVAPLIGADASAQIRALLRGE